MLDCGGTVTAAQFANAVGFRRYYPISVRYKDLKRNLYKYLNTRGPRDQRLGPDSSSGRNPEGEDYHSHRDLYHLAPKQKKGADKTPSFIQKHTNITFP
jgi:hypothetical protein